MEQKFPSEKTKNYGMKIGNKSEINTNKPKYQSWTRIWAMDERFRTSQNVSNWFSNLRNSSEGCVKCVGVIFILNWISILKSKFSKLSFRKLDDQSRTDFPGTELRKSTFKLLRRRLSGCYPPTNFSN